MAYRENEPIPVRNYRASERDELTGILNQRATICEIEDFLQGVGKNGTHALLVLDIDNLHEINERLGHECGDEAIRNVAKFTASNFRRYDIVGRMGEDEFAVLVKHVSADVMARKTRELLNSLQFVLSDGENQTIVSVSAGIVMCGEAALSEKILDTLYKDAKDALKDAKNGGRNSYAFSPQYEGLSTAGGVSVKGNALSFDLRSLLNNLRVGIVIFQGESPDEIKPVFCNTGFLQLCNIGYDEFKKNLTKENNYGTNKEDLEGAREVFIKAYKGNKNFQHSLRMNVQAQDEKWFTIIGSIQPLPQGGFYVYSVFMDADKEMNEREIDMIRYEKAIAEIQKNTVESFATVHLNLTRNTCEWLYRKNTVISPATMGESINTFINTAAVNVAYEEEKQEFIKVFNREATIESFNSGIFVSEMKAPILMEDGRVLWCMQSLSCFKNPLTGDLEAIMRLIDADVRIRVEDHYARVLQADYEYVADIDPNSGILTVISAVLDRGAPKTTSGCLYMANVRSQMEALVEDEFVEAAIHALDLDTILDALSKEDIYTCTYPAKKSLLGRDGAFQWRFGYATEKKRDIVFTRRETMGFLDKRQQAQPEGQAILSRAPELIKRKYILIADDVEMNREMLKIIFEEEFEIIEAADGEEAIQLIDENYKKLALILLDLQMPKKTGLDVLIHLKMRNLTDMIPVMMVTGEMSLDANLRSLEYGIADIVNKPFDSKIVRRRALNLIAQYAHKEDVERQLEEWKQEAMELHLRTEKNNELLINALSSVVEFRSLESGLHINRVRKLTEIMLRTWTIIYPEDRFDKDTIDQISRASTLHDIGKVAIPDSILLKPGKLTAEEFEVMKMHTVHGCNMLEAFKNEDSDFYRYCYEICRYHHERGDGRGYPDALTGDQIPIWAQIVSIVDVFDALISPRVYKEAYSPEKAVDMIYNGECGVFSDKLLKCFKSAQDQIVAESTAMAKGLK